MKERAPKAETRARQADTMGLVGNGPAIAVLVSAMLGGSTAAGASVGSVVPTQPMLNYQRAPSLGVGPKLRFSWVRANTRTRTLAASSRARPHACLPSLCTAWA